MFIERLKEKFAIDTPIFTSEIIELYPELSRAQIFRNINKAQKNEEIIRFSKGVYFIPEMTILGLSTITADDVVEKKYIHNGDDYYGVYSDIYLVNAFSLTTQMAAVISVVSNREPSRKRMLYLDGRRFILEKSRCEINKENVAAYTILQLFTDKLPCDELDLNARRKVLKYISTEKVTRSQIYDLLNYFPLSTAKKLYESRILNEIKL